MYQEKFAISSHDADPEGTARPACVLRYMQECANHQMRDEGPSYMDLFHKGKAFLLSRIVVRIFRPLHQYETIQVSTWPCGGKGASFYRSYRVEKEGEAVAEAASIWALADVNTRRLYRFGEVPNLNAAQGETLSQEGMRFQLPEKLSPVGRHIVAYHETDCNRHLNNTNYPDVLLDFLPERETHFVSEFSIHFAGEALVGEEIHIWRSDAESTGDGLVRYFRTEHAPGRENIEARVRLSPRG